MTEAVHCCLFLLMSSPFVGFLIESLSDQFSSASVAYRRQSCLSASAVPQRQLSLSLSCLSALFHPYIAFTIHHYTNASLASERVVTH